MDNLPIEILQKIFTFLSEKELVCNCRFVNKLWKEAADMTLEVIYYKGKCKRDHAEIYEEAHKNSGLSWRELYKSLNLWPKINEAKVDCDEILLYDDNAYVEQRRAENFFEGIEESQYIKVLKNGVFSYPCNTQERYSDDEGDDDEFTTFRGDFDTICYYDSATLKIIHGIVFESPFDYYEETEDIIAFQDNDNNLTVYIKSNKKKFEVGAMLYGRPYFSHFTMFNNHVFFQTDDQMIWESKHVLVNDDATIETKQLVVLKQQIVSITIGAGNELNILSKSLCGRLHIHVWDGTELTYKTEVDKSKPTNSVINLLKQYGFKWHDRIIYRFLTERRPTDQVKFEVTNLKDYKLVAHGNTILICTSRCVLNVYPNVYRKGVLMSLKHRKPTEKFHLTDYFRIDHGESLRTAVRQFVVVEIKNGHRIIILRGQKVVKLDLTH